jgi:virginiamycin B lyase
MRLSTVACIALSAAMYARQSASNSPRKDLRIPRPGVGTPGVKREPSTIRPLAIFNAASGTRDWQVLTEEAVCVTNGRNSFHWPHVHTNKLAATINLGNRPCSGLAAGFGAYGSQLRGHDLVDRSGAALM